MFVLALVSAASAWDGVVDEANDNIWSDPDGFPEVAADGLYYQDWGFWVDIAVQNIAYDKQVGIVWTDDGWTSVYYADAWYEYDLGDGYEQWGVDFDPAGTLINDGAWSTWENMYGVTQDVYGSALNIEFAVYATIDGVTYWDNNGGDNFVRLVHEPEYREAGSTDAVLENLTGLVWARCPARLKAGSGDTSADCAQAEPGWQTRAQVVCDGLNYGSRTDWRLPTAAELTAYAVLAQQVPTLHDDFFPNGQATDRSFWTSTNSGRSGALTVSLGPSASDTGATRPLPKRGSAYAWCVAG